MTTEPNNEQAREIAEKELEDISAGGTAYSPSSIPTGIPTGLRIRGKGTITAKDEADYNAGIGDAVRSYS